MALPIRTLEEAIARIQALEDLRTQDLRRLNEAYAFKEALSGRPAPPGATLSVPHNDTYANQDNVDASHALNLDYLVAGNVQRLISARLSFKLRAYRTYNSLTFSSTGAGTSHSHSHNHGSHNHSHSHSPTLPTSAGSGGNNIQNLSGTLVNNSGGSVSFTVNENTDATNTTPSTDATTEASHTHPVSGSVVLGVTEGAVATGVTISFDGVDQTVALRGPFNSDVVELDVLKFLTQTPGAGWHVISLLPSGLGRIQAYLRLSAYVNGTLR